MTGVLISYPQLYYFYQVPFFFFFANPIKMKKKKICRKIWVTPELAGWNIFIELIEIFRSITCSSFISGHLIWEDVLGINYFISFHFHFFQYGRWSRPQFRSNLCITRQRRWLYSLRFASKKVLPWCFLYTNKRNKVLNFLFLAKNCIKKKILVSYTIQGIPVETCKYQ